MKRRGQEPSSKVYFLLGADGAIKIGWSACIQDRLTSLQVSSARDLCILRLIDGGPATEAWLHRKFADRRIRGEWFRFDERMMTVVPPDEIPVRQQLAQRRDVRLTIKEHVKAVDELLPGMTDAEKMFLLFGRLDEAQRGEVLNAIRAHVGLPVDHIVSEAA